LLLLLLLVVVAAAGVSFFFAEAEASFVSFFGPILKDGDLEKKIIKNQIKFKEEYVMIFCT
jgi:hypothetical protein